MDPNFDQILSEATETFMVLPGVTGVGEGECAGKRCIVIFVAMKTPEIETRVPATFKGIPIEVRELGVVEPQSPA